MKIIVLIILGLISIRIYAKKCADFSTQKEAQAWYEQRKESRQTGWKSLDRDKDGFACDCLPGGNGKKCPKKKR